MRAVRLPGSAGFVGVRQGGAGYQACVRPQCGQPTEVETSASNANPQLHA
jgi:hypothetical protein